MAEINKAVFDDLLREFGSQSNLARKYGISPAAITKWKRKGVPSVRMPYFELAFPKFEAWKLKKKD